MKNKSVFIAGIWHETNTFSRKKTFLKDFKSYQWLENKQLIKKSYNTNTEIGGFLDTFNSRKFRIVPSLFAAAVPSGIVTKNTFLKILNKIISYLNINDIDGVALALHGALVVEGIPLPECFLVNKIKKKLKKNIPIVATFDLHANLSFELFNLCDMLIGYDTFPHVDMGERGREVAHHLCNIIITDKRPKKLFQKLPMLTVPQMQSTNESPMNEIMRNVFISEKKKEIKSISVSPGFPYSDIKDLGLTIVGYGSNLNILKNELNKITEIIIKNKNKFTPSVLNIHELERKLLDFNKLKKPIIISDPADNVGGGALGNNLEILEILLKLKLPGTIVIWAPFIKKIYKNNIFDFIMPPSQANDAIRIKGEIIFTKNNHEYVRDGLYMTGQIVKMGNTIVVKTDFNLKIILTENRVMPFDDKHIKTFGIDPENEDIIVTKSGSAWKIAFGKIAKTVFNVDTGGICSSNLDRFSYSSSKVKKYWPLNK